VAGFHPRRGASMSLRLTTTSGGVRDFPPPPGRLGRLLGPPQLVGLMPPSIADERLGPGRVVRHVRRPGPMDLPADRPVRRTQASGNFGCTTNQLRDSILTHRIADRTSCRSRLRRVDRVPFPLGGDGVHRVCKPLAVGNKPDGEGLHLALDARLEERGASAVQRRCRRALPPRTSSRMDGQQCRRPR
jgi:hypothetical protein